MGGGAKLGASFIGGGKSRVDIGGGEDLGVLREKAWRLLLGVWKHPASLKERGVGQMRIG